MFYENDSSQKINGLPPQAFVSRDNYCTNGSTPNGQQTQLRYFQSDQRLKDSALGGMDNEMILHRIAVVC